MSGPGRRVVGRAGRLSLVALVGLALSACTAPDEMGSPAHRMATWATHTSFGQQAGTVIGDARRVAGDQRDHADTQILHTVCAVLLQDTGAAYDSLPSPDQRVSDLLGRAYVDVDDSANDCYRAGSGDPVLQARSAREGAAGLALLGRALGRADRLIGRPVSTTTTTQGGGGGIFG